MARYYHFFLWLCALSISPATAEQQPDDTQSTLSATQSDTLPIVSNSTTDVTFTMRVDTRCSDVSATVALFANIADTIASTDTDKNRLDAEPLTIGVPMKQLSGLQQGELCERKARQPDASTQFRLPDAFSAQVIALCIADGGETSRRQQQVPLDIVLDCSTAPSDAPPEN